MGTAGRGGLPRWSWRLSPGPSPNSVHEDPLHTLPWPEGQKQGEVGVQLPGLVSSAGLDSLTRRQAASVACDPCSASVRGLAWREDVPDLPPVRGPPTLCWPQLGFSGKHALRGRPGPQGAAYASWALPAGPKEPE